jgi:NDP-sugar pyrophosphorylase family protein
MRAIILAGGKGTRLKPYTATIPKPLVPIGGEMPILEVIIKQLSKKGFNHITIALNHMADFIKAFFGNGEKWNVKIDYSTEDKPLSTIGPLTLIKDLPNNFLVMNGDILCDLDYQTFFQKHCDSQADVSVSTYKRDSKIDFGVLKYNNAQQITTFIEKPVYQFDVSMGIYCLNKKIIEELEPNQPYGFDNLMLDGIKNNKKLLAQPFDSFWLDIGRPDDYEYANDNWEEIANKLGIK